MYQVDEIVRKKEPIEKALDLVDREILVNGLGFEGELCATARKIWKKMQRRRLKRGQCIDGGNGRSNHQVMGRNL